MDSTALDVELFIEEVKQYPEIWDLTSKLYHDKHRRQSAWYKVCDKFCEGFSDKQDEEKDEISSHLMKKWKNIRDAFSRSYKKRTKPGPAGSLQKQYVYSRHMQFLLKNYDSQAGVDEDDSSEGQAVTCKTEPASPGDGEDADDLGPGICQVTEPHSLEPSQFRADSPDHQDYDKIPAGKRRKIIETSLLKYLNSSPLSREADEQDDDREFFNSLMPAVRTLSLDAKLEFRGEVIKLLGRIRRNQN